MRRTPEENRAFIEAVRLEQTQNPTKAEQMLKPYLETIGFEHQRPMWAKPRNGMIQDRPYCLDFFHPDLMLCVEVDGSAHRYRRTRDRRRDKDLEYMGIRTIRITNGDVLHRLDETIERIRGICDELRTGKS